MKSVTKEDQHISESQTHESSASKSGFATFERNTASATRTSVASPTVEDRTHDVERSVIKQTPHRPSLTAC